jgi:hypothetical protein
MSMEINALSELGAALRAKQIRERACSAREWLKRETRTDKRPGRATEL